jgi:hypothetical protein
MFYVSPRRNTVMSNLLHRIIDASLGRPSRSSLMLSKAPDVLPVDHWVDWP